ncbi:MAG: hemerythrin domain-containing protein [Thermoplasmata archaeon]
MVAQGDLFTPIHKGLRTMIYGLSGRLQTNDFADGAATEALITDLENDFAVARSAGCALCILAHHAVDEESFVFPAVASVGNKLITELISEHHDLTRRELEIAKAGHELLSTDSAEARVRAGVRLNIAANQLFGAYLVHMNREEAELVPLMQEHFSDPEMAAMQGKIIGQIPPDRLFAIMGWMLPSLNVTELSRLLSSLKSAAPPQFMKAVSDLCAARVDPTRWDAVKLRVGL